MKKILISSSMFILLAANALAVEPIAAPNSFYVQGNLGYGFNVKHIYKPRGIENKYSGKGILGSIALGYKVLKEFRVDGEFYTDSGFQSKWKLIDPSTNESFKTKLQSTGFFLNAYYDLNNSSKFIPFIGFGTGYLNSKISSVDSTSPNIMKGKKSHLAWKGAVGVSYAFTDKLSGIIQYQYLNKKFKTLGGGINSKVHAAMLGVRYSF